MYCKAVRVIHFCYNFGLIYIIISTTLHIVHHVLLVLFGDILLTNLLEYLPLFHQLLLMHTPMHQMSLILFFRLLGKEFLLSRQRKTLASEYIHFKQSLGRLC